MSNSIDNISDDEDNISSELEFDEFDEFDTDEIIEIDDEDLEIDLSIGSDNNIDEDDESVILSKHKIEGKHSLKYDSIFKGKKDEPLNEDEGGVMDIFHRDSIEIDKGSAYWFESIDNERYIRNKQVKEMVYDVLLEKTTINFLNNRRKPSKVDFNKYYHLLKSDDRTMNFTNIELFNELAIYFSDNLFNMFKLLDNEYRMIIMNELQDHIGSSSGSKEVSNRNIYEGTELEFTWEDEFTNELIYITGDVIEVDYKTSMYVINSYERVYKIHISSIVKILNNTKFKYNMNRLNNIDFL